MNGVIPATLGKMWEMNLRKNSKIPTDENKNSFVGIFTYSWKFFYLETSFISSVSSLVSRYGLKIR